LKETDFIEQNKKKWNRFEQLYESKSNDPEELSELYMDITDDLSYSQTFYSKRTVRVYLNQLAQKVYTGVHKQKGESLKKFITVWKTSLPIEIYRARKNLLFALIAFVLYAVIGAVTTAVDPEFPRMVMGDGYVDMTLENIKNGNPLAVYESESQINMFVQITSNNMKVAFMTFFVGFFFTFGTHILLFYNGIMLGAFQYFFHVKGLLITSFLGIWIHGAFEISAIVLAGGAGITAGNGLLFPKSYTRLQSLQIATKRGLKIMLSLVPFIIIAGFLESFVTANYQELPNWSKWMLILLSFGIILFYYLFYPIYVARKHPDLLSKEEVLGIQKREKFSYTKIRGIGENISDSFRLYKATFTKFSKINLLIVFPIILVIIYFQFDNHYQKQQMEHWYDWATQLELMMGFGFKNSQDFVILMLWTIVLTVFFSGVVWSVKSAEESFNFKSFFIFLKNKFFSIWIGNTLIFVTLFLLPWYFILPALFIVPFFMVNGATMGLDPSAFFVKLKKGFKFSKQHYGNSLVILLVLLGITVLLVQPFAFVFSMHDGSTDKPMMRDFLDILADFVKRIAQIYTDDYIIWANMLRQIVYVLLLLFILPVFVISTLLSCLSELEKTEARGLWKELEKFGERSRNQEKEIDFD